MIMRTLPREPFRGGQVCGHQLEHTTWTSRAVYCGERKAEGLYYCEEHDQDVREECGRVRMAPGNALGDRAQAVQLLWEPYEGDVPMEATAEEVAAYVAA